MLCPESLHDGEGVVLASVVGYYQPCFFSKGMKSLNNTIPAADGETYVLLFVIGWHYKVYLTHCFSCFWGFLTLESLYPSGTIYTCSSSTE